MATITKQQIIPAGLAVTYATSQAGPDKLAPGPTTFLHVKNVTGSPITVTIDDPLSVSPSGAQSFNPDLSVTVPATTGDRMIGPLPAERFASTADGMVNITYSAAISSVAGLFL